MPADITPYTGPLAVTIAYVLVYYGLQIHVMNVKNRLRDEYAKRDEKFDRYFGNDREMLAADRYQLNMLEHMPPFVVLLWLNAVFVGSLSTTIAGAVYVVARAIYPFTMGRRLGRGTGNLIFLATGPGYAVLIYFAGALVWAAMR